MTTSIKNRTNITVMSNFVALACCAITLPLLAIADGQHNDKTCYAETAGGIEISSSCSSRGTTCNDDFTCSIGGVAGNMGDGLEMNKADIIPVIADDPKDTSSKPLAKLKKAKKIAKDLEEISNMGGTKATDYNSSRRNRADRIAAPDGDDDADGDSVETKEATADKLGNLIMSGGHSDAKSMPGNGPELVELGQPTYDKPSKAKSYIKIGDIKGNARSRGDVILEDVTVVKELDKSSTDEACNAVDDDCDDDVVD